MLYQPAIVSRHDALQFTSPTRRHPVLFQPWMFRETAETTLPAGFEIEEMPKPVSLETPFGSYTATFESRDGKLLSTRSMRFESATVLPEQYDSVRRFFDVVRSGELAPVVLSR
jgi:hypothetical protein